MILRRTKLQLAVFALITLVGISFVSARYVGLGDALLGRGYVVTADMADSGGIFAGAEVTYRGVNVGKVDRLRLSRDGVRVDLRIDGGPRIPADTLAVVENRSAVGEQYVDLQPRRDGGPFLHAGSQIPRASTRTPVATSTLLLDVDRLVGSVNRDDLTTVVDELGQAFRATGPQLQRLIDDGDALTTAATESLPETVRLIDDGRTVLDTQRAGRQEILRFSKALADLSDTLRSSDPDLRKVVEGGSVTADELDRLLRGVRPSLGVLLGNLLSGAQVSTARIPGLRQVLITYPYVVAGGFTVVPGDGTAHFGLALSQDPPPCTAGYGGTRRRQPSDTSDAKVNMNLHCAEPRGSKTSVRGAQHAPRPSGGGSADRAPATGEPGGWPAGSATGTGAAVTSATPGSLSAVTDPEGQSGTAAYVAGYDPVTGELAGPDGRRLVLGGRGGQQAVFGEDSWQWLLLGPLSATPG